MTKLGRICGRCRGESNSTHRNLGKRWLYCEGSPELLFTENETNHKRCSDVENHYACVKDGINDYVVHGERAMLSNR